MGVFQADQTGPGEMDVFGADGGLDILQPQCPIGLIGDRVGEDPPRADMPPASLRKVWELSPRITSSPRAQWVSTQVILPIVPLTTRRAASFPTPLGGHGLEPVHRGVLAEDVIAQRGVMHGLAHGLVGRVTVSLRRSMKESSSTSCGHESG